MTTRAPTHIGKENGFVLIDLINAIPFTLAANPLNALTIGTLINIVAIIADAFRQCCHVSKGTAASVACFTETW
jgi:hypothetical protein